MSQARAVKQEQPKIGMISIGQSPRPDILSIFKETWRDHNPKMVEIGALDGLSHTDVQQMAPQENDDVLIVRMADGQQYTVGRKFLIPRIKECADFLMEQHVTAMILLCTGDFRPFHYTVPFVIPQKIVDNTISALVTSGQVVGVMIPTGEQQKQMRRNLMSNGIVPVFASASPHLGEEGIVEAAHQLKRHNVDFIVMHCFGYTQAMRNIVRETTGKPVLLPNILVAKVTEELLL
jgi:protein AroM